MTIPELQEQLIRQGYPYLHPDEDPDIERYFFLRSAGRANEALGLYHARLKPRYPNEAFRTALLKSYRRRDPVYTMLLRRAYQSLGIRLMERVKRLLQHIAGIADTYDPRDVYSTIRAAETIRQGLPPDRYEAVDLMERLYRYAQALEIRPDSLRRALELIRAYLDENLAVADEARRDRSRRQAEQRARERRSSRAPAGYAAGGEEDVLGLRAIQFSPEDIARVEIPASVTGVENRTIAYCAKYWNRINDGAYERILFLYSRKCGVKNYDIYQIIRRGRRAGKRDDEILTQIMSALVQGYYYSILGDRYVQRRWAMIKAGFQTPPKPNRQGAAENAAAQAAAPEAPSAALPARPAALPARPAALPARPAALPARPAALPARPAAPPAKPAAPPAEPAAPPARPAAPPVKPAAGPQAQTAGRGTLRQEGSVADRLRELSGRSYDVYHDQFLARAPQAVKRVLGAGRGRFFTLPQAAEDLVINFLTAHYDDPYMNWGESDDRAALAKLGFELESLAPVIDECYKLMR